jgi:hypothetical protein
MTDWALVDETYPDDAPGTLALQDALRDDYSDDDWLLPTVTPRRSVPELAAHRARMAFYDAVRDIITDATPPGVVRMNNLGFNMMISGPAPCGRTAGRLVQYARDKAREPLIKLLLEDM